jgi:hypothetical protein
MQLLLDSEAPCFCASNFGVAASSADIRGYPNGQAIMPKGRVEINP